MSPSLQARFHSRLADIDAAAWDALLTDDNPFLRHAFLSGLETSGSLRADYGWRAHHLGLYDNGKLVARSCLQLKSAGKKYCTRQTSDVKKSIPAT